MKLFVTAILIIFSSLGYGQGTFYTVNGMNVCVFTPASYKDNPTKKYPTIVFMPGAGEIGLDKNKLVQYGPNAYVKQTGSSTFGGVEFIVVSFQQTAQYSRPWSDKVFFDFLYANFRVDKSNIFGTGLSRGWWHNGHYATYQKTVTDLSYITTYKGLCIYEGQPSDDKWDATLPYPEKFGKWAKLNNGYLLAVHNRNSAYYSDKVVKSVNDSMPNHAWYFEPLYGNGGHGYWSTHFGGDGLKPAKYDINGKQLDMYEFFASLVNTTTTPPPPNPVPPTTVPTAYCDSIISLKEAEIKSLKENLSSLNIDYSNMKLEYMRVKGILNNIVSQICNK